MAHGSDIRRIGKYMRAHGADGSLVAWVEAELDRIDLSAIPDDALAPLREDLTLRERELIVASALHLAGSAAVVRASHLGIAEQLAHALGVQASRIDAVAGRVLGRTMAQAHVLARLDLPIDAEPAEVQAAERARPGFDAPSHVLDSLVEVTDPQGPPPLSYVLDDLPPEGDKTESQHHTEQMDHLAEALRALQEPDDLEEPTVEMSRDEARQAAQRARDRQRSAAAAPPRFSPAAGISDGPPSLGVGDDDLAALGADFDLDGGTDEGPLDEPIPWDDDGLEVPEWTISERPSPLPAPRAEPARRAPSPTLEPEPEPEPKPKSKPIVVEQVKRAPRRPSLIEEPPLPPLPELLDDEEEPFAFDVDPAATPAPAERVLPPRSAPAPSLDDLAPDAVDELSLEFEADAWGVRRAVTEELPLGLTDEVPTLQPLGHRPTGDGLTDELRVVDPEAYEELMLDEDDDGRDGLTSELRPVADEPRPSKGGRRESWSPPAAPGESSDGLDLVLEEVPGNDTFQLPLPEDADVDDAAASLQPLDQGLKAYWGPGASGGGLAPQPLRLPADFDDADDPGGGLTGELKVVHDDEEAPARPRRRRRGAAREGLTQELQPLFEASRPRQRRRGSSSEGLTQELKPLLDED